MNIKDIGLWLWKEIHRGNMLVIAGCVFAYFAIALPIYKEIKQAFNASYDADAYIMQNIQKLESEIKALKSETKIQLKERKSGKVGITRH